jgi:hypothetical protein
MGMHLSHPRDRFACEQFPKVRVDIPKNQVEIVNGVGTSQVIGDDVMRCQVQHIVSRKPSVSKSFVPKTLIPKPLAFEPIRNERSVDGSTRKPKRLDVFTKRDVPPNGTLMLL